MKVDTQLNRGMAVDVKVGESIKLVPAGCDQEIVISVEHKQGQRSRLRVQSVGGVRITRDEKITN